MHPPAPQPEPTFRTGMKSAGMVRQNRPVRDEAAADDCIDRLAAEARTLEWCGCFEEVDKMLASRNTALLSNMLHNPPRAMVETVQIESGRGKPKRSYFFASYCPFCGTKYPDDEKADDSDAAQEAVRQAMGGEVAR